MSKKEQQFVNGFDSWLSTYFEITRIGLDLIGWRGIVENTMLGSGSASLATLFQEWTNEFESTYGEDAWIDRDFYEEAEIFVHTKNSADVSTF